MQLFTSELITGSCFETKFIAIEVKILEAVYHVGGDDKN